MKRLCFALALALVCGTAAAKRLLVDDIDEFVAYAEVDSIERLSGRTKMWVLYDYKVRHTYLKWTYWSQRTLAEFDCRERRARTLYYSYHAGQMGGGELVVGGAIPAGSWSPVHSASLIAKLWDVACAK